MSLTLIRDLQFEAGGSSGTSMSVFYKLPSVQPADGSSSLCEYSEEHIETSGSAGHLAAPPLSQNLSWVLGPKAGSSGVVIASACPGLFSGRSLFPRHSLLAPGLPASWSEPRSGGLTPQNRLSLCVPGPSQASVQLLAMRWIRWTRCKVLKMCFSLGTFGSCLRFVSPPSVTFRL